MGYNFALLSTSWFALIFSTVNCWSKNSYICFEFTGYFLNHPDFEKFQWLVLDDFDVPSVNWKAVMSSRSDDRLVDCLTNKCEWSQIISTFFHKCGNTPDLAFFSKFI